MEINDGIEPGNHLVPIQSWRGAADRGLQARREREQIIAEVLEEGEHYGRIPGVDKAVLLKPGAEAITDALNCWPDYVQLEAVAQKDDGFYFYRYRCLIRQRGTDVIIASGIGSCNTYESKYRWRTAQRNCPSCGQPTLIVGKEEYGGGWICWQKKGGCGEKFVRDYEPITSQRVGRVSNPDIHDTVNTVDKMAQKRSLVAASLNLGFSQKFTQDLEDLKPAPEENGNGADLEPSPGPSAPRRRPQDVKRNPKVPDDLKDELTRLEAAVMMAAQGDPATAQRINREITENPGKFRGFSDLSYMNKDWQFKNAWGKLKNHDEYFAALAETKGDGKEDDGPSIEDIRDETPDDLF